MIKRYGLELLGEDRLPQLVEEERYNVSIENITDPKTVTNFCQEALRLDTKAEEFVFAIFLDTQGKVLGISEISHGNVNTAPLNSREIFIRALLLGAAAMILVHNHPSSGIEPSMADEATAQRIYEAGQLINIQLIDSIIIGGDRFFSFKESQIILHN